MKRFKFLGVLFTSDGRMNQEMDHYRGLILSNDFSCQGVGVVLELSKKGKPSSH